MTRRVRLAWGHAALGDAMSDGDVPWTILSSSVLRAVRYDSRRSRLTARFTSGRVYEYSGAPPEIVQGLLDPLGGSHGRYFNDAIRDRFDAIDISH